MQTGPLECTVGGTWGSSWGHLQSPGASRTSSHLPPDLPRQVGACFPWQTGLGEPELRLISDREERSRTAAGLVVPNPKHPSPWARDRRRLQRAPLGGSRGWPRQAAGTGLQGQGRREGKRREAVDWEEGKNKGGGSRGEGRGGRGLSSPRDFLLCSQGRS